MIRSCCVVTLVLLLWGGPAGSSPAGSSSGVRSRHGRAEALYRHALRMLERNSIETRRSAMRDLEEATLIEPSNPEYQLTLARVYYQAGFLRSARTRFERVVRMAPGDAAGRFGLGQVWRRDWLKYLEPASLMRAIENFSMASRLNPGGCDGWLMLAPLLVERDDLAAAANAAERCYEADPRRPDASLAVAYTAYRRGQVERADSVFDAVVPRLPRSVRERFEDISPVATERDTMVLHQLEPRAQAEFVRKFWKDLDPDLASPANEARLEYWARVAHAYFLFYNAKRREWDERGEVYARYGRPGQAEYNPLGAPLSDRWGMPVNSLVWQYQDLGMQVVMQDRTLSEFYLLPIMLTYDPDPAPNPDSLARRSNAFASGGGRGVFPKLPPGVEPLPVEGAIARFETGRGSQVLTQIESPGGPGDSLWADWVVVDTSRTEVSRAGRSLSPSACDATGRRVADFAAELPAGHYVVGLSVRDGRGRRGVYRGEVDVGRTDTLLALSDVVICCGTPELGVRTGGAPAVRLEPNPGARVNADDPLTAYFEIYHLNPGPDGQSRFEYVYTVRSAEKDPRIWIKRLFAPRREPPPISASRAEENPGSLRRQFVSVPVRSLPAGKYRLEIKVRDLNAGNEVARSVPFVKLGSEGLRN